jgi:hypothetical protein
LTIRFGDDAAGTDELSTKMLAGFKARELICSSFEFPKHISVTPAVAELAMVTGKSMQSN